MKIGLKASVLLFILAVFSLKAMAQDEMAATNDTASFDQDNGTSIEEGEQLFKQNCKSCHALDARLVGPPLKNVQERRSEEWLHNFIRSSQSMIQEGEPQAVQLFNEYNQLIMPDQDLTDGQINAILAYVESASQVKEEAKQAITRPVTEVTFYEPLSFRDYTFWIIYTIVVGLVVAFIYYMAEINAAVSNEE